MPIFESSSLHLTEPFIKYYYAKLFFLFAIDDTSEIIALRSAEIKYQHLNQYRKFQFVEERELLEQYHLSLQIAQQQLAPTDIHYRVQ